MMTSNIATLAALWLSVLTSASPSQPQSLLALREFQLVTQVSQGNAADFGGRYLASFHTGAALGTLVGVPDATHAQTFYLNHTFIDDDDSSNRFIPHGSFAVGLQSFEHTKSSAPRGYLDTSDAAAEDPTGGFEIGEDDMVMYTAGKVPFETFAMCHVDGIAPYESLGPQYQLLWRNRTTPASYEKCADVELKAVFLS